MKFEKTEVWGFEHAIRGMRNPKESWDKSDSRYTRAFGSSFGSEPKYYDAFIIGENDLVLMQKLIKAGSEHRKFLRQIFVSVDITAPRYWWTEFDTYKVGVTRNSCSTMHKLSTTPITYDCFEHSDLVLVGLPETLEELRKEYLNTKNPAFFLKLKANLPESWLQKATVTMNYENILNMMSQRRHHRLTEWSKDFMQWADSLPYVQELLYVGDCNV